MPLDTAPFRRAGLDVEPAELERLVMEAVERVLPLRSPVDGRTELSEEELRFLQDAGVDMAELSPQDRGVSSPLAQTAAEYAAILATALTVSDLAARLGVDVSRIRQRLGNHTLYGIKDGKSWRIPLFQLDDPGQALVPGLQRVMPALVTAHPVEVARWFTLPHVDLENTDGEPLSPRTWLTTGGDPGVVATLAEELHGIA